MTTRKAASRHLLLAEIVLGTLLCCLGAAKSAALKTPAHDPHTFYALTWFFPALVGSVQAAMAGVEWIRGKRWELKQLQHNVCARGMLAFVAVPLWLYEVKEFVLTPNYLSGVVVLLVAPVCCAINIYSVYANRKVWCALDPRISTSGMHFD